jgi:UDP-glucose 4-epimerase
LAALHFIPHCDADPQRCLSINVEGTQNVLDAVLPSASVRALVFASTAAVYAPDERAHDENSRLAPTDVYGLSKLAGEQLVSRASDRYDVPVGIARLFNVYGPGETNPHLIPAVIQQAEAGERLALGNLSTARDYVFTDDVARGLTALLDASLAGQTMTCNLGTGEARRGDDVVAAVGDLVERQLVVDTDPERVRQSDRPVLQADASRALDLLAWSPQVSFAAGLQATRHHVMQ